MAEGQDMKQIQTLVHQIATEVEKVAG
jgi:hypothetical protein